LAVLGHIVEPMKVIKDWRPIGFLSIGALLIILVPSFESIYLTFFNICKPICLSIYLSS
jgi:hypothetical protein